MLRRIYLFFILTGVFAGCGPAYHSAEMEMATPKAIVGGQEVSSLDAEAPYSVFITLVRQDGSTESCTGTFVAPSTVLTAGHCVSQNPQNLKISFGPDVKKQQGQALKVKAVRLHPRYKMSASERNDLALIYFEGTLPEGAKSAAINPTTFKKTILAKALGYGRTQWDVPNVDGKLRSVKVMLQPLKNMPEYYVVNQTSGRGVCYGDSGGPALGYSIEGNVEVYGVATTIATQDKHADPCSQHALYMNVSHYYEWITKNLK